MDLRRRRTRLRLKEALIYLLGDDYFENITVNDICVEAMVSRPAFYSQYKDKYDLLEKVIESSVDHYLSTKRDKHIFIEDIYRRYYYFFV
nr:TetR/AcrR family transcriptional regulator [Enterococcus sp. 7F3_DIV0205]OTN83417.1 hypothetical protein A5821_003340 [Enterococcus sp. 7F3_DIV0205]